MSFLATCGWTALSSLLVALMGLPLSSGLAHVLREATPRRRGLLWGLLLTPLFTPPLLTGYAYANFSLSLLHAPLLNRGLYILILTCRLLSIGTLIKYFAPPDPLSPSALHCGLLLKSTQGFSYWSLRCGHLLRSVLPAFSAMFLIAFQEFELSSLMVTDTWTVWLFDAQALQMDRPSLLSRVVLPLGIEAALLLMLLRSVLSSGAQTSQSYPPSGLSTSSRVILMLVPLLACVMVTVVPTLFVVHSAWGGLIAVARDRAMPREVVTSLGYGLSSGLIATYASRWLWLRNGHQSVLQPSSLLLLPGLFGALILSLAIRWLFQLPGLLVAYDTVLPTILALILYLLPRAFLVQLAFAALASSDSVFTAQLLQQGTSQQRRSGQQILWDLQGQPLFLTAAITCLWGYFELTPAAILSPPGVNSAPVRLYNQMHFGRGIIVSGMLLVSILTPLIVFVVAKFLVQIIRRRTA